MRQVSQISQEFAVINNMFRIIMFMLCIAISAGISIYGLHYPPLTEEKPSEWLSKAKNNESKIFYFSMKVVSKESDNRILLQYLNDKPILCKVLDLNIYNKIKPNQEIQTGIKITDNICYLINMKERYSHNRILKIFVSFLSLLTAIILFKNHFYFDFKKFIFVRKS